MRLAAFRIRRRLVDLARHYFGPEGIGANHQSGGLGDTDGNSAILDTPDTGLRPSQIICQQERWQELYAAIEKLPGEEQEVVELLSLHELTQEEAAELTGIPLRTLQRHWQRARLRLFELMGGNYVPN